MFTPHGTFSPDQLIAPLTVLFLGLAIWGWMFRDMLMNNDLPPRAKDDWTLEFILLNVFAAAIYFGSVYQNRRR